MKWLNYIVIILACLFVVGCNGQRLVETHTPEPVLSPGGGVQTAEDGDFTFVMDENKQAVVRKLDEDGNVLFEEIVTIDPDEDGNFEVSVTFEDGSEVTISGRVEFGVLINVVFGGGATQEDYDLVASAGSLSASKGMNGAVYEFEEVAEGEEVSCGMLSSGVIRCWRTGDIEFDNEDEMSLDSEGAKKTQMVGYGSQIVVQDLGVSFKHTTNAHWTLVYLSDDDSIETGPWIPLS